MTAAEEAQRDFADTVILATMFTIAMKFALGPATPIGGLALIAAAIANMCGLTATTMGRVVAGSAPKAMASGMIAIDTMKACAYGEDEIAYPRVLCGALFAAAVGRLVLS